MSDITNEAGGDDVMRLRAHAVGIARDIADAFAKERNDGNSSAALFRHLADHLLAEPELVRTIAAWHAAALHQVDGGKPHAAQPEAQAELRGLDTATRVRFYEHDFYVLSNFSAFTLYWRGLRFDTSEAAYHWEKFTDSDGALVDVDAIRQAILTAPSAHEAFKIAEKNRVHRRPDWDDVKVGIMIDILRAKAAQHEYVRRKLLATGDRELVEDSWRDDFWGWGPNRGGKNMLGRLWMQVRAELRAATPPTKPAPQAEPAQVCWRCKGKGWVHGDYPGTQVPCPVCGVAPQAEPAARPAWEDASASERTRARSLLARHCSLELRATLSAHQEEWWRLNREREASEADILQVLAAGLRARRVEPGRVMSDAQSAAAVDALRDAELPQAVPGRARDLARKLRDNFDPISRISDAWSIGMVANLLEEVADNWNRRPAAGMVLSQSGKRSSLLGPVVIDVTARWAGAKTGTDGWLFSHEAWQKFVEALSTEPPLEIQTSPGVSAPESVLHASCIARGCQQSPTCSSGECAIGPGGTPL